MEYKKNLKKFQTELSQPKTIANNNNIIFKSTFSPSKLKIFDLVKSCINTLFENNVNAFTSS